MSEPSTPGDNGRDEKGRFRPGNTLGRGNPHAAHVARLRSALLDAVEPGDLEAVVVTLCRLAREGDVPAAKLLMDRLLGPPVPVDLIARIEALETSHDGENGRD
jgi:hypothetical protein